VLLGPKPTFSIDREFTPSIRDPEYLLTLRLIPRIASQRIAFGGLPSVFFNLVHSVKAKHSNPVLVDARSDQGIGRASLFALP
jgi:hypothetical protein